MQAPYRYLSDSQDWVKISSDLAQDDDASTRRKYKKVNSRTGVAAKCEPPLVPTRVESIAPRTGLSIDSRADVISLLAVPYLRQSGRLSSHHT